MNSFLKRYRDAISVRLVTDRVYYEFQHGVIERILSQPDVKVIIAADPEDTNHIYGYCIGEAIAPEWMMLHFVYVKLAFRRFGLATTMLKVLSEKYTKISYSHSTALVKYLDKNNQAAYVPSYVWAFATNESKK